jgi:hypothetical protein
MEPAPLANWAAFFLDECADFGRIGEDHGRAARPELESGKGPAKGQQP